VCEGAARELGRALSIVGHGLRDRQLRGPPSPDAEARIVVVPVRRYRCRRCDAVITVVPPEVEPRRHYSKPAIALAFARLGLLGEPAAAVRRAVSPWRTVTTAGWRTLDRWAAAVADGRLFHAVRVAANETTAAIAARVAQAALGHAPPSARGAPRLAQVFVGAVHMA
jgi:hypothetical protein